MTKRIIKQFFLSFPRCAFLQSINQSFLFHLNAHNMLNTHIYHQLPPTCFGVCYIIFKETIALLAQNILKI